MTGDSRSTRIRWYRIHRIFLRDKFTNCTKLAGELEVGIRTILRDIEAMRRQDYPIEYDSRRRRYFYSEPVYYLPTIQVGQSELLALRVAAMALAEDQATPFAQQLRTVYRLLLSGLRDQVPVLDDDCFTASFSFHNIGIGIWDAKVFEQLIRGVLLGREVEFDYEKPGQPTGHYRVRPYLLTKRDGLYYLVAAERGSDRPKAFAVSRIKGSVTVQETSFVRPKQFSAPRFFRNSFRVFSGGAPRKVRLRFSARAAPYVKERRWHASQDVALVPDGGLLVTFTLGDTRDLRSWVLRWGSDVEVLEPPELRDEVYRELHDAMNNYAGTQTIVSR